MLVVQSHDEIKRPRTLQNCRDDSPVEGRLDRSIHLTRRQSVPRELSSIEFDAELRYQRLRLNDGRGETGDAADRGFDFVRLLPQHVEVFTEDLDRNLS